MIEIPESKTLTRQLNDTIQGKTIRSVLPMLPSINLPGIPVIRPTIRPD